MNKKHTNEIFWKGVGEVPASEINYLPVKIDNPYRTALEAGFIEGVWDSFTGVILRFGKGKQNVLFEKVFFESGTYYDIVHNYCEEHLWVSGDMDSIPREIGPGDTIEFFGRIYLYRRANGTLDYGITDFKFIAKIEERHIPSEAELTKEHEDSFISELACEQCLYYDKCSLMVCYFEEQHKLNMRQIRKNHIEMLLQDGEPLYWWHVKFLLVRPDKLNELRWLWFRNLPLRSLAIYYKLVDNCFMENKELWEAYMKENGFDKQEVFDYAGTIS